MIPVNSCFRACGHRMAPQVFFLFFFGEQENSFRLHWSGADVTAELDDRTHDIRRGGRKKFSVSNDDDDYGAAGDGNIMSLNRLAVEFAWRADELARTISLDFDHLL